MKSIRSKILVSIVLITFLTVSAIAFVFYKKSAQMIEDHYAAQLYQQMRLLTDTVDEILKDICSIDIHASCDGEIVQSLCEYLKYGSEDKLEDIADGLRSYGNRNAYISSVYLLIPEKEQIITSLDYPLCKNGIGRKELEEFLYAQQSTPAPVIINDMVHEGGKLLSFTEPILDESGQEIGYICMNVDEKRLFYTYFNGAEEEKLEDFLLLNGQGLIVTGKQPGMGETFQDGEFFELPERGRDISAADQESIYVCCQGAFSRCLIFARTERSVILGELIQMRKNIVGILAFFSLLSLIPAVYITKIVYKPVQKLTAAMQKVSQGEMDTRGEVATQDEIGMMADEFNSMLDQIERLIHQVMAEEEQKKDAELEALQYQITPHFMYNTLNSIKCMAYMKGEKEIAGVIDDFVELLQNCISKKGGFLRVEEEIHILQKYIGLIEFRSGERYQVDYDIAPGAKACRIPRLLLQPLVENSLLHGMDMSQREGRLEIRAWVKENILFIEVTDNGRGMSEEQIRELLTAKAKKTKGLTAIGIPNVKERLKLYYKEKADLSYRSSAEGTTALIYMPAMKDGEIEG